MGAWGFTSFPRVVGANEGGSGLAAGGGGPRPRPGRLPGWSCRAGAGRSGCHSTDSGSGRRSAQLPPGWCCGPARCRSRRSRPQTAAPSSPTQGPGGWRSGRASPPTPAGGVVAGELLDPSDVGARVVVGQQGPVQVAAGAVSGQLARRGRDGVGRVIDVAAAVALPGRGRSVGQVELHRPGTTGPQPATSVPVAVESGTDPR